jgi:phosphatidylglycerophosphatase A
MSAVGQSSRYRDPWLWVASGLGSGFSPKAPGTVGSFVALLPYWLMRDLHAGWLFAAIVAVFIIGVIAANRIKRTIAEDDPGLMVLDEWVGQWITLSPVLWLFPAMGWTPPLWFELLAGFALFRLFDILKPWPVSYVDREVKGGFGAMLDDALAGIYAAVALCGLAWCWSLI